MRAPEKGIHFIFDFMDGKQKLGAIKPSLKSGKEGLTFNDHKLNHRLIDYWRWSASDILSNSTRGKFAEFIVGTALGLDPNSIRNEWDAFDLTSPEGIKIEVKSSAYIQSWNQNRFSQINFSIKPSRYWDKKTATYETQPKRQADLYIFCLLKHKDQATIDPLKLEQWEFYLLPTAILNNCAQGQSSISLSSLNRLTEPINYENLRTNISQQFAEKGIGND